MSGGHGGESPRQRTESEILANDIAAAEAVVRSKIELPHHEAALQRVSDAIAIGKQVQISDQLRGLLETKFPEELGKVPLHSERTEDGKTFISNLTSKPITVWVEVNDRPYNVQLEPNEKNKEVLTVRITSNVKVPARYS